MVNTKTTVSKKVLAIVLAVACMVAFTPAMAFTSSAHAAAWKVSPTKATVYVGKYKTLKSTKTAKWTSSKKSVAKLTASKGKTVKVKGVKAGTATISVKYKTTTKKIKITVKKSTAVTAVAVANYTTGDDSAVMVGDILKATTTPAGAAVTYQWMADGAAISGATEQTYKVEGAQVGKTITCKVTGTGSYNGTVTSTATAKVTAATIASVTIKYPTTAQNTAGNALVNQPYVGDKLTATAKTASGQVLSDVTYQWCYGAGQTAIKDATDASYTVTKDMIGQILTCKVTGKTGVTGTAVAATATKTVSNSVAVSAVKSSVTAGATLETAITPSQAASDVTYQWAYKATSAGSFANISGATSATYVATNPGYYQVTIALKTGSTYGLSGTTTATYTVAKSALPAVTSKNVTGAGALTPRTTNLENDVIQIAVGTIASTNYNIQWYALDAATDAPSASNAISGATGTSYTLASTGVGKYIVAVVTGANDTDYQGAEVASSQYFVSGTLNAPTISGNKTVGSTLTATVTGNSTVTSKDYTLQWYRVTNDATATETAITGATGATYKLTDADMGYKIMVVATGATNYTGTAKSAATTTVITTVVTAIALDQTTGTHGTAYTVTPSTTPAGATGTYAITTPSGAVAGTDYTFSTTTGILNILAGATHTGNYEIAFTPSGNYSGAPAGVTFVLN